MLSVGPGKQVAVAAFAPEWLPDSLGPRSFHLPGRKTGQQSQGVPDSLEKDGQPPRQVDRRSHSLCSREQRRYMQNVEVRQKLVKEREEGITGNWQGGVVEVLHSHLSAGVAGGNSSHLRNPGLQGMDQDLSPWGRIASPLVRGSGAA